MMQCARLECQTTGGCAHRGPLGQMCYFPAPPAYTERPMGCICPPTSEQTCQNGLCPRKGLGVMACSTK
jgi:hypothetical protein